MPLSSVVVISVLAVTPAIDVDRVETEIMLIVERDAGKVIVVVGEVPVPALGSVGEGIIGGIPMTAVPLVEGPGVVGSKIVVG